MTTGQKLKLIRKELRLTQEEMASQAGISQQAISAIEGDRGEGMSMDLLRRLVVNFKVNPYFILLDLSTEPKFAGPQNELRKKLNQYEKTIDKLIELRQK